MRACFRVRFAAAGTRRTRPQHASSAAKSRAHGAHGHGFAFAQVRRHLLARGSRTVSVDVVETSTGSHEWEFHEEFLGLPSQGGDSKGSPKGKETTKAKGSVDAIMSDDGSGEPNHQLQIKRIERMVAEEEIVFCIEDFRG